MNSIARPLTTLHAELRRATARRHRALDAALDVSGTFADLTSYASFLARTHQFQSQMELALDRAGAARFIPDWPQRRRTRLIELDLAALGQPLPATAPALAPLSGPHQEAAVLGAAYVLEGSTLGGKLLLAKIGRLDLHATHGGAYFHGHGAAHGPMWRGFLDLLAARDAAGLPHEPALEAACAAFDVAAQVYGVAAAS
jgi:heme oxygenase